MTSIQLPTLPASIVTNIWEDTIKCDADMVLRNVHKKNYDKVVEQIKHIVPDSVYKKQCYRGTLMHIGLLRDFYLFTDSRVNTIILQKARKMYGEKAIDLIDKQLSIEDQFFD